MEEDVRDGRQKRQLLESSVKDLGKERDVLSNELDQLRGKLRTSNATVDTLRRQLNQSQERHEQLVKQHEVAQKQAEANEASSFECHDQLNHNPSTSSSCLTTCPPSGSKHTRKTRRRTNSADRVTVPPSLDASAEMAAVRREAEETNLKLKDQLTKKDNKIKGLKAELRAKQNQLRDMKDTFDKLKTSHETQIRKLTEKKTKSDNLITELRNRVKNLSKPKNERSSSQSSMAKQKSNLEKEVASLKAQIREHEKEFRRKFKNWEAERDDLLNKQRNLKKKLRDVARYPPPSGTSQSSASVVPPSSTETKVTPSRASSIDIESRKYSTRHYDEHSAITKMILEKFAPATREAVDLNRKGPVSFGDVMGKMNAARQLDPRELPVGAVPPCQRDADEESSVEFSVDMRGADLGIWMETAEQKRDGPSRPPCPHGPPSAKRSFVQQDPGSFEGGLPGASVMEFGYTPAVFDDEQFEGRWDESWESYDCSRKVGGTRSRGGSTSFNPQHNMSRSCTPQHMPPLDSCSSECSDHKKRKNSSSTDFTTPTPPIPENQPTTIKSVPQDETMAGVPQDENNPIAPCRDPWWDATTKILDPGASIWTMH